MMRPVPETVETNRASGVCLTESTDVGSIAAEEAALDAAERAEAVAFVHEVFALLGTGAKGLNPLAWVGRLAGAVRAVGLADFHGENARAVRALAIRVAAEAFRAGALAGAEARRAGSAALRLQVAALLPEVEAACLKRWGRIPKGLVDVEIAALLHVSEHSVRRARNAGR